ncbi:MAG: DNA-binding protein [endosymbiont of Galathealinum brachiosum]|uniref:DNA-binding protein n=1 Tax=endosymbiont of Galathealinum brachiosum TaxID=2200906 RepID=A0A370DK31_9GAMM|nr:MAG: DNA-binding protein [endosymbiont of Galathealinum brachiosum]
MNHQRALTESQAAEYLSVSRSLLRQSRMNGERENRLSGPAWIKLGSRSIRYLIEDLDTWLESFPKSSPNPQNETNTQQKTPKPEQGGI